MPSPSPKFISVRLHPQEVALITAIRKMRFGTIETLGISNGLPAVLKVPAQRVDLTREAERAAVLRNGVPNLIDLEQKPGEAEESTSPQEDPEAS